MSPPRESVNQNTKENDFQNPALTQEEVQSVRSRQRVVSETTQPPVSGGHTSTSAVAQVFQIHVIVHGAYAVSKQQEADPIMKKGDRAVVTIKTPYEEDPYTAEVEVLEVGATGSYQAIFKVSTPDGTQTVSEREGAVVSQGNGASELWVAMEVPTPVVSGAATVHFSVKIPTGDE